MKKVILFLFCVVLVIFGCTKDSEMKLSNGSKVVMSIDDPYGYTQINLEYIAKGLPAVMNNGVFRSILSTEVGKCFDGDYNVLFVRLVEACDSANLDLITSMKIYLHANGEDSSLFDPIGAFQNIEGNNYYPQIYIPSFLDNNWDNEELPVAIAFNGDESVDMFVGYTVGSGNLYDVVNDVTEDFAYERQIWVVSLNECVDDDAIPLQPCDEDGNRILLGDETDADGGSLTTAAKIYKMEIKERFENWAGGRSDVAIRSFVVKADGTVPLPTLGYNGSFGLADYRGDIIKRVSKGDIGSGTELTINSPIVTQWGCGDQFTDHIHFVHIIFERDCWPASRGFGWTDLIIEGNRQNVEIRSYDQSGSNWKQAYVLQYITSIAGINNYFYNTPFVTNNILISLTINKKI